MYFIFIFIQIKENREYMFPLILENTPIFPIKKNTLG